MESLIEEFSPKEILERGEIVDGTVISIQNNGLVIDLGQKSEGFVPKNEMKSLTNPESYEKGKQIITYVIFPETQEGTILLSVDRARGEKVGKLWILPGKKVKLLSEKLLIVIREELLLNVKEFKALSLYRNLLVLQENYIRHLVLQNLAS